MSTLDLRIFPTSAVSPILTHPCNSWSYAGMAEDYDHYEGTLVLKIIQIMGESHVGNGLWFHKTELVLKIGYKEFILNSDLAEVNSLISKAAQSGDAVSVFAKKNGSVTDIRGNSRPVLQVIRAKHNYPDYQCSNDCSVKQPISICSPEDYLEEIGAYGNGD